MEIGRQQGNTSHLRFLQPIRQFCKMYKVAFKINSVINIHNWEEDMNKEILELSPVRWKVYLYNVYVNNHESLLVSTCVLVAKLSSQEALPYEYFQPMLMICNDFHKSVIRSKEVHACMHGSL